MGEYSIVDFLALLIQLATPFLVLYITIKNTKREKDADAKKAEDQKAAEQKDKEFKEAITNAQNAVEEASKRVESLSKSIAENEDLNNELKRTIKHVAQLNQLNGQYTHELAQLVIVMAEGIRDQHLDGNITRAISKYREFESKAIGNYITGNGKDETI